MPGALHDRRVQRDLAQCRDQVRLLGEDSRHSRERQQPGQPHQQHRRQSSAAIADNARSDRDATGQRCVIAYFFKIHLQNTLPNILILHNYISN